MPEEWSNDPKAGEDRVREARERIPRIRQGEAVLQLQDREGRPLSQVDLALEQTRADFPFGDKVSGVRTLLRSPTEEDALERLRQKLPLLLDAANVLGYWTERPANDLPKTEEFPGISRLDRFAAVVEWVRSMGLRVKGHPLCWSIPKAVPDGVLKHETATRFKFLEVRIRTLVARFKGKVDFWDAVNECLWEPSLGNIPYPGPDRIWPFGETFENNFHMVSQVLRWAREEDAAATFILNDYGLSHAPMGTGADFPPAAQRARLVHLTRALGEAGLPPGALGLQSHIGGWKHPESQLAAYDDLARAGVPLHVTEFRVNRGPLKEMGMPEADPKELHWHYLQNVLTCAFGHPQVEAFFFWGGRSDFMPKAMEEPDGIYARLRRLLRQEWRTRLKTRTDAEGRVSFRGFFGDDAVTVKPENGAPIQQSFRLRKRPGGGTAERPVIPEIRVFPAVRYEGGSEGAAGGASAGASGRARLHGLFGPVADPDGPGALREGHLRLPPRKARPRRGGLRGPAGGAHRPRGPLGRGQVHRGEPPLPVLRARCGAHRAGRPPCRTQGSAGAVPRALPQAVSGLVPGLRAMPLAVSTTSMKKGRSFGVSFGR